MLTQNKSKILIIDDDEDDYFIIADYIKQVDGTKFIIEWCNNYQSAVEQFKSCNYDIYFVDYRLGNETGLELLKEAILLQCDSPIILLTGKGNKAIDIEAMKSGATDYLIKSELNTEKLERCIRYSLDRASSLKALKESENKYRNLFARSKDSLFIADKDLRLKEVNQMASKFFGYTSDQLHNIYLYDFISGEGNREKIKNALRENKNINDVELEIENGDKEKKTCLLSIVQEKNSTGQNFVHGIMHDITNIKKAEKVNLQTEKLAANERLVRILAHEIRNPLNNIKLSADNLGIINANDEKQKTMIGIIQRNSTRINQMITELLDSTKTLELVFDKHSLQDILAESLSIANDRINLQKIRLNHEFPSSPFYILADKSKLKIAFSNILINAIEAMEEDKGKLLVSLEESGKGYTVSIKDNGRGIPPEHLSKLFEPFFTMKKNGMGLGLSAAYGIFKSHKAAMHVESVVDSGTTFIMDFEKHD